MAGLQPYSWRRGGGAQEPGIDSPGGQHGELLVAEAFADGDPDCRVGVPVGPDDRGQQGQRDAERTERLSLDPPIRE
jgi:hypothetical protein